MEIFTTIKDKVSGTAMAAVAKTNELVETTKLRLAITEAEADVERCMKEIGTAVYEQYKLGFDFNDEITEKCSLIDSKNAEINDIENQINVIRNVKQCPTCKYEVNAADNFCPKCGVSLNV